VLTLFYSKAQTAWTCPKKYYWVYKRWLQPAVKPKSLQRGAAVHKIVANALLKQDFEQGLAASLYTLEGLKEEDVDEVLSHTSSVWEALGEEAKNVVAVEKVFTYYNLNFEWKSKVDFLLKDVTGMWVGELKTTNVYNSTLQRLYHKGIQPLTYSWVVKSFYPEMRGIRMLISQKGKPCVKEDIPLPPFMLDLAKDFIYDSYDYIRKMCEVQHPRKNRINCQSLLGECPYTLLCAPNVEEGSLYFEDVVREFFTVEDPEAHLQEEEV
jgi:hypothetical protein